MWSSRIRLWNYKTLQDQRIFDLVHRGSGGPEFWNSEIRKCCTFHFPHVLRVMEDDFSRAARKMFQNALMNLNVFFKKKARAARKFQKFRGICTFHFPLGACATCLAGDPEIVKLCTLLQWIWFFAVILDKMQVWGTKKDALCTWCFRAPCRWQSIILDQAAAAQILGWGAGEKNSRNLGI